MREEEQTRIAREEMDETGFLPRLERLLLATDESPAGKFTARLAGLIAGAQGMPVTIVQVDEKSEAPPLKGVVAKEVKSGARQAASKVIADAHEPDPEKVHLTERAQAIESVPAEAVKAEVRKGYDMLFIGVAECCDEEGGFTPLVSKLAREFTGNIALLSQGGAPSPTLSRHARLLVAVNGTEISRNAAEITFALARATGAGVTAVYAAAGGDRKRRTRTREEELLKDMARLAERYGVKLQSRIAGHGDAARAILRAAARHSLIVMGVSVRPGSDLFFGNTATQVMTGARRPVLFLANRPADSTPPPDPAEKVDSTAA
jgi:nucleotide-binding universal stress UspA family protein